MEFRPFRNPDPPELVRLWRSCGLGRGAALGLSCDLLDMLVLGHCFFDPAGLIVAQEGSELVGFVHAGFGPNAAETGLDHRHGVICAVLVHPGWRRQGIGARLVQEAEAYLKSRGATTWQAGASAPFDPFYFGLYGGSEPSGFLESDTSSVPFMNRIGYQAAERFGVWQRSLQDWREPVDFKLVSVRRNVQVNVTDQPALCSPWWVARCGHFDTLRFLLQTKSGSGPIASITGCGMDLYAAPWGSRCVGLTKLRVDESQRRKGYAKILLFEVLRAVRDLTFDLVEAHIPESDVATTQLIQSLGFQRVDTGVVYRRP